MNKFWPLAHPIWKPYCFFLISCIKTLDSIHYSINRFINFILRFVLCFRTTSVHGVIWLFSIFVLLFCPFTKPWMIFASFFFFYFFLYFGVKMRSVSQSWNHICLHLNHTSLKTISFFALSEFFLKIRLMLFWIY